MAINAATPVIRTVPTIAGPMPPPAKIDCTWIGLVRKSGKFFNTTERPLRTTSSMMKNSGMSARSTEPTIQMVASQLRDRRPTLSEFER